MPKGKSKAAEAARQEALAATKGYSDMVKGSGGGSIFNLPQGVDFLTIKKEDIYDLNFLPYRVTISNHPKISKGNIFWTRTIFVHYDIGVNNERVICPRTVNLKCPVCDYRTEIMKDGDYDQKETSQLKAKVCGIYNVAYPDDPEKVMFWVISAYKFGQRLGAELDYATEDQLGFWLPDSGLSLRLRMREETLGSSKPFIATDRIDFVEREHDYDDSVLDKTVDLDNCCNILEYQKLWDKFYENEDLSGNGEEKTDTAPEPAAEQPAGKKPQTVPAAASSEDKEPETGSEASESEEDSSEKAESSENAEEAQEEAPAKDERRQRRKRQSNRKQQEEENPCPKGHVFGEELDAYPDCEECPDEIWNKCADAYDKLHPEEKK